MQKVVYNNECDIDYESENWLLNEMMVSTVGIELTTVKIEEKEIFKERKWVATLKIFFNIIFQKSYLVG